MAMCVAFEWAGAILSQNIKWLEDPAKNLAVTMHDRMKSPMSPLGTF
jgi:hypothetical protein